MFTFDPEVLIDERASSGFTQQELADKSGVSITIISRYERGLVAPRPRTAFKLASALGISRKELYIDDKKESVA